MKVKLAPLTIIPSNSPHFYAFHSYNLGSAGLDALASKELPFHRDYGKDSIPLSLQPRLPPGHFELFMPVEQQSKEGVIIAVVEVFLNCHEVLGLLLYNRRVED